MGREQFTSEEVGRRGRELYQNHIRAQVETEPNIGLLVSIDIETGDYEIGSDKNFDASRRLRERHPDATVYIERIGYNAVDALGGILERTAP